MSRILDNSADQHDPGSSRSLHLLGLRHRQRIQPMGGFLVLTAYMPALGQAIDPGGHARLLPPSDPVAGGDQCASVLHIWSSPREPFE